MLPCTLCSQPSPPFAKDRFRAYFRCPQCELVFADPLSHVDPTLEKQRYDLHQNDAKDNGYRIFLSQLAHPLCARLQRGMEGLDYGCGPGPVFAQMLEEAGMVMEKYDPFYEPQENRLRRQYDFVTATEVVEHFRKPSQEWPRLNGLIKQGGWLGIMTRLLLEPERFLRWDYSNDFTHVSFYSPKTMAWLGERFGLNVEILDHQVILMQKIHAASPL